jgi:hypothetical protein
MCFPIAHVEASPGLLRAAHDPDEGTRQPRRSLTATGALATHLDERAMAHQRFEDLHDVLDGLPHEPVGG